MSTLRKQEPVRPGLQRSACVQVELAIRSLTRQAGQADAAKQAIEQARAVLALIEPDLPRPAVRRDRTIITRLMKGLDELTTPAVLARQLDQTYKKNPSNAALASALKTLRKRYASGGPSKAALSSKAGNFNPAIYRLVADMAELRGHMGTWPTEEVPGDQPPRGLRRTYTKAHKLGAGPITAASLGPAAEATSELAIQLNIIAKACPTMLKAQRKLLSRTAGELIELRQSEALDAALRAELGKSASKSLPAKQPVAKQAAEKIGSDFETALVETPTAFMKRVQAYWSAWRAVSKSK